MKKYLIYVIFLMLAVSCTTTGILTKTPLTKYNKDIKYGIEERPNGFAITLYYSRYQFIPESSALATACKSSLTSIAWDIAEMKGKKIKPINEQRIKLSMGRNGLTGITSCIAMAIVEWE
jgi:hypothetical protein